MIHPKLVCPKCGYEFSAKLGNAHTQVVHVAAPGTAIACPNCGATFSLAEAYPKEVSSGGSVRVFFLICGAIFVFIALCLVLR